MSLTRKLGIKPGMKVLFLDPPVQYFDLLENLPEDLQIMDEPQTEALDFIHLFCSEISDLDQLFPVCKDALKKNGSLWVSWPKKASGRQTDLNGNIVREFGLAQGLVDVKVASVDEVWSALKFMYRIKDR